MLTHGEVEAEDSSREGKKQGDEELSSFREKGTHGVVLEPDRTRFKSSSGMSEEVELRDEIVCREKAGACAIYVR